jgi:hypothetical protein
MLYRKRRSRVRTLAGKTHEHRRTPRPRDRSRYRAVRPSNFVSFGRWRCHRAFTDLAVGRAVGLAGAMGIPRHYKRPAGAAAAVAMSRTGQRLTIYA